MPRAAALPTDVETLQGLLRAAQASVAAMSAQLRSRDVLIENLKLQLARLKRMKFGRSSEHLDAQIAQLELSLEALEANAAASPAPPQGPATRSVPSPLASPYRITCLANPTYMSRTAVRVLARIAAENCAPWVRISRRCLSLCPSTGR
jgi:hypothetical protein